MTKWFITKTPPQDKQNSMWISFTCARAPKHRIHSVCLYLRFVSLFTRNSWALVVVLFFSLSPSTHEMAFVRAYVESFLSQLETRVHFFVFYQSKSTHKVSARVFRLVIDSKLEFGEHSDFRCARHRHVCLLAAWIRIISGDNTQINEDCVCVIDIWPSIGCSESPFIHITLRSYFEAHWLMVEW